jgi:hypothetical protein
MKTRLDMEQLPPRGDQPRSLILAALGIVVLYGIGVSCGWVAQANHPPR